MRKSGRGKWNKYLVAGLFMTGLAVFLGILGFFWTHAPSENIPLSADDRDKNLRFAVL